MAKKVLVTMGEIMLRLAPHSVERIVQASEFQVVYGGGEANVAVSGSNYGLDTRFVTKLPSNDVGQAAINHLRKFGVDTNCIARGGNRIGIYYLETGAAMRPSQVIYDRAGSSIAEAKPEDFNFDEIFKDAVWFHTTGILPALSDSAAHLTEVIFKEAKKRGVTVSIDLNYRKKLWSSEKAKAIMTPLMQYVDVCIGNEEDAEKVLGFKAGATDVTKGELELAGYQNIFSQMKKAFPNLKYIATTLRESFSANHNGWSAVVYDGKEMYQSRRYDINPIADRVGGGDSFAGGFISAMIKGKNPHESLEFAVAASALKHTILGDSNHVKVEEVETLMKGDSSGRVQR